MLTKRLFVLLKQTTQLRLLNELSTRLQSLMGSENFYQQIVEIIQNKFHYYSLQIWTTQANNALELKGQSGAYVNHLPTGYRIDASHAQGITGTVVRTKKSYLSNDVTNDPNFTNLSLPVRSKSQLCVPILKDEEVIATLNLESDQINAFDEDDVIAMEAVAGQIAVAISNRRIYNEARDFNKRLQQAVEDKTLELRKAHERILDQQKLLQRENKALKNLVNQDNKTMEIVGNAPAIQNILTMVDKIAPTDATVLIQGESGTGKELIARRLHFRSLRAERPYVVVNCGALQESLLESELFGHEKGSFTGAVTQKMGLVETADGGTLFLDEIGELSAGIQAKLLRFLQDGEFYRIGGKKSLKVNLRVISATNRDLEQEVKAGRFREDLFYRLNTIAVRMPPLRKRKEDIPQLVDHFLKNSRFGGGSHQWIKRVDPRVYEALSNYDWPGNIRELQNTVERLKILSENNEIKLDDVPFSIRMPKTKAENSDYSVNLPLDEIERSHILRSLAFHQGNKTKTAHSLGITIKTLYNKLHRYGVLQSSEPVPGESQHASAHGVTT